MSSCCEPSSESASPPAKAGAAALTVALAGNPNSGKTTIFNALTGLRQKVANYPGVTVEKKTGRCKLGDGRWVDVIDLPGTYSLISRSPDEFVAMEILRGLRADTPVPDVVVVVVDASNLQRNLYLVSQLIEVGRPMVVALNMMDVAERRGLRISPEKLQQELGVPVVPVVGHKRRGVDELKSAIARAAVAPLPQWPLPEAMKEELMLLGGGLAILDSKEAPGHGSPSLDDGPVESRAWICAGGNDHKLDRYQALAERLLIGDRAGDIAPIANQQPVSSLLNSAATRLAALGIDPMQADIEAHYQWIDAVARRSVAPSARVAEDVAVVGAGDVASPGARALPYATPKERTLTDKIDAILIDKVWGLVVFAGIMAALFVTVFWIADPMMGALESAVGWVGEAITSRMSDGPIKDLLADGIFAGVGAVVVFVPQIALLFLFLAVMEDSGYLARAAFLMDKLLGKVGLHGKSFIPLLSSFACAIPGIMATRTIENRKDRLATIFIAPFMSCSARLPVYFLLIGAFFPQFGALARGGIMFALYALGVVAAVVTAWLFKRTFLKGPTPAFILEMPTYKLPQVSQIARQVWFNTSKFLTKAGTTIFFLSIIIWAMMYYPRLSPERTTSIAQQVEQTKAFSPATTEIVTAEDKESPFESPQAWEARAVEVETERTTDSEQLRQSIAGRLGHLMEPVIRPLGYDWKMGVGLVGAFAAREVFVSTLAITYNAGSDEDTQSLSDAMVADRYADGRPVWTVPVALSLLVWFVLAMQCMSTLAIVRRETGAWGWPLFMLLYMNGLAYALSFLVYHAAKMWA